MKFVLSGLTFLLMTGQRLSRNQSQTCQCHRCYYNECRTYSERDGTTPMKSVVNQIADIIDNRWKRYSRGLFELPVTASTSISPRSSRTL